LQLIKEAPPLSLLTGSPDERLAEATEVANALSPLINTKKLYANINGRKHVLFEGWTTLGALVGVFPVTAWTRPVEQGWEARVEARTLSGAIVGAAEAQCLRTEKIWSNRDDYALRSMAQTRAGGKALRMPLGFIMSLAGYEATPAEEIPRDEPAATRPAPKPSVRRAPPARKSPPPDAEDGDDGERSKLFGLATEMWGDKDTHTAICAALSLPSEGEGAIREHWLDKGGTYKQAQPYLAEVRRHEVGGKSFEDACRIVNAFAQLTEDTGKAT
ncbi:hypothetical protein LCGC14_1848770, partial [marine sediment metagenome]